MDRERVTALLAAVVVLVGFVGITSPSAPAAEPLSKAATALDKLPAAVLQAVQGTAESSGALADRAVRSDASGRIQLDFHAASTTGSAEEADLAQLGADGIRSLALSPDLKVTTGMIEAWVPADAVIAAAGLPWVTSVTLPAYGQTSAVTGAGVALHKANLAQAKGITGAGGRWASSPTAS